MTRLNQRIDKLPELASLKNGDTVTIYDDGSVTGSTWEGTYVYHPAGSSIQLTNLYARWKDGLVAIHVQTDPAEANSDLNKDTKYPFATYVEQQFGTTKNSNGDEVVSPIGQQQVTKRLITEPTSSTIWRIPDNAWLFRENGNGQMTALVDVFEFRSGSTPVRPVLTESSNEWEEAGTQPVAVMVQ